MSVCILWYLHGVVNTHTHVRTHNTNILNTNNLHCTWWSSCGHTLLSYFHNVIIRLCPLATFPIKLFFKMVSSSRSLKTGNMKNKVINAHMNTSHIHTHTHANVHLCAYTCTLIHKHTKTHTSQWKRNCITYLCLSPWELLSWFKNFRQSFRENEPLTLVFLSFCAVFSFSYDGVLKCFCLVSVLYFDLKG